MPKCAPMLLRLPIALAAAALHAPVDAGPDTAPPLAVLAAQADLVALAQVMDTDYQYTRSFPSGGTAFLRVLIPYKVGQPYPELVQVYEEGLHEDECYFPNPAAGDEGGRYLVFLRANPARPGQYLGLPAGCKLQVLVTADNGYALRYPPAGIDLDGALAPWVQPQRFGDRLAVREEEQLEVEERKSLLADGWITELPDGRFVDTHGVPLGGIGALLGEENLTLERALLRPQPE